MEEAFLLVKELSVTWSDVEAMEVRERRWLLSRLEKWSRDKQRAYERAGKRGAIALDEVD